MFNCHWKTRKRLLKVAGLPSFEVASGGCGEPRSEQGSGVDVDQNMPVGGGQGLLPAESLEHLQEAGGVGGADHEVEAVLSLQSGEGGICGPMTSAGRPCSVRLSRTFSTSSWACWEACDFEGWETVTRARRVNGGQWMRCRIASS